MAYKFNPFTGTFDEVPADLNALSDVDTATNVSAKNDVLMFDGSNYVPVPEGTTFLFNVSSFTESELGASSTDKLIGSGNYKSAGAVTFTITYVNGPATAGDIDATSTVGWTSNKIAMSAFTTDETSTQAQTTNPQAIAYPTSLGTSSSYGARQTFSLSDFSDGTTTESDSFSKYIEFSNQVHYGKTSTASSYDSADIDGLATSEITNDNTQTWNSVTAGSGEYLLFAMPTRLGVPTFWVGGIEGGFESPETVSNYENDNGFQENYYVWRSTSANLGATVVETKS